jgi:hypothetical protein
MSRSIKNPRILLLDCPLEYKKGTETRWCGVKRRRSSPSTVVDNVFLFIYLFFLGGNLVIW